MLEREVLMYNNFDLETVQTPIKADVFARLLNDAGYNQRKTYFLIKGLTEGFSIGYEEDPNVKLTAPNLQLRVGTETDLWNKVMKEVKLKRYTGSFNQIPFGTYIQSPIGLVPKDHGKNTRLIFHLSYPRTGGKLSVNANTPDHLQHVKYSDSDEAIQLCILAGTSCHLSKSDMTSAFRQLGIFPGHWKYLIMKAKCPLDGKWYFFLINASHLVPQ